MMKDDRYYKFFCDIENALSDFSPVAIFPDYPEIRVLSSKDHSDLFFSLCLWINVFLLFYSSVYTARARFNGKKALSLYLDSNLRRIVNEEK